MTAPTGKPNQANSVNDIHEAENRRCDECGSDYFASTSPMLRLCAECAHWLYGYPHCVHEFSEMRCSRCGWDGSVSEFLSKVQQQAGKE